jgi:type II secretory pathway pseudopilin PulG
MWGGFSTLKTQLGSISSALAGAQTAINTYFADNSWLANNTRSMQNANLNLYNNYNTSTLYNPDPTQVVNITPYFIQSSLGPNGTAYTMVTNIDGGMQVTQKLTNAAISVDQAAKTLVDSIGTIQSNINVSQN